MPKTGLKCLSVSHSLQWPSQSETLWKMIKKWQICWKWQDSVWLFFSFWIPHINYDGIMIMYQISTCSSVKCGLTISIKRPSVEGEFFDETAEYKWWVWVLDWWVLIIMHISPSLKRACTPPGQTAVLCCPQQVFIPAPRNLTIYPPRIFGCPAYFLQSRRNKVSFDATHHRGSFLWQHQL